jgi:glutamate synthase (NADPH/NADH)
MGKDPREFCVMSEEFLDDGSGKVKGINTIRVEWTKSATGGWDMKKIEGSQQFFPADLVLLSMGFLGPEDRVLGDEIEKDARKNVKTPPGKYSTNVEGIFAAGDCRRGQSLIVWVSLLFDFTNALMANIHIRESTRVASVHGKRIFSSKILPFSQSQVEL